MSEYSKEIVETYWNMMGESPLRHATHKTVNKTTVCGYCGRTRPTLTDDNMWCEEACPENKYPRPITLSPPELAEYMRDQCVLVGMGIDWEFNLVEQCFHPDGLSFAASARIALRESIPEQRICAAVKAWEVTHE